MKSPYLTPDKSKLNNKHWKTLDLSAVALLVIDLQHYFTDPASHAFVPNAPSIQKNIQKIITRFKTAKRPVIYTYFAIAPKENDPMLNWWGDTVKMGSKEAQLTLTPEPSDLVLRKPTYSAFHGTTLHDFLQVNGIKSLVITGLVANLCCETTARDAFNHGYDVFFGVDSTAAYSEEEHCATLLNLSKGFATPLSTDEL